MDPAIAAALAEAITDITAMVTAVIVMAVGGAVGIIALNKGAKFGLKWISGMLNQAG